MLMDIGVHALDLLQWWLGKTAVLEYADDAMGGIEANCLIRCRLECGATGEVAPQSGLRACKSLHGPRNPRMAVLAGRPGRSF